jgi:hypothetical protein
MPNRNALLTSGGIIMRAIVGLILLWIASVPVLGQTLNTLSGADYVGGSSAFVSGYLGTIMRSDEPELARYLYG